MRNIKLTISYHGKYFSGWQIQKDVTTIQEEIEKSLSKLLNEKIKITGSGRTDAGVHAIAQIANFNTKNDKIPLKAFVLGMNRYLAQGIAILDAQEIDLNFNARKSAKKKTYIYQIHKGKVISPLEEDFYYLFKYELDFDKMQEASNAFIGEHDFASFAAAKNSTKTTIRTIYDIKWTKTNNKIFFEITGNGFLMKMVRNIIGTLIEIGNNKKTVNCINKILEAKNRSFAGSTAPAKGLFLKEVFYD